VKLDDAKIRDAFKAIHSADLTRDDAATIIDVARFAASVDGRMDMAEMATVARLSKIVYGMSGEREEPVPSTPMADGWLAGIRNKLTAPGTRELAYASARLIILVDRKVTKEETDLATKLSEALRLEPTRVQALDQAIDTLVREADTKR
jgi:hypothetical protein